MYALNNHSTKFGVFEKVNGLFGLAILLFCDQAAETGYVGTYNLNTLSKFRECIFAL